MLWEGYCFFNSAAPLASPHGRCGGYRAGTRRISSQVFHRCAARRGVLFGSHLDHGRWRRSPPGVSKTCSRLIASATDHPHGFQVRTFGNDIPTGSLRITFFCASSSKWPIDGPSSRRYFFIIELPAGRAGPTRIKGGGEGPRWAIDL